MRRTVGARGGAADTPRRLSLDSRSQPVDTKNGPQKKPRQTSLRAAQAHARAVAPLGRAADLLTPRAYPSAAELFADGTGWRAYVTDTLRALLAPAALAGAVGLAGCAGTGDAPNSVVGADTASTQSSATLTPLGQPTVGTSAADGVVVTPLPPSTLTPIPPGAPVVPAPPPRTHPPRTPPAHPTPNQTPVAIPGGLGRVVVPPIPPAAQPPAVRGEAVQLQPAVAPPQALGSQQAVDPGAMFGSS